MLVHPGGLDEGAFECSNSLGGDDFVVLVAVRGGACQCDEADGEPTPQSEEDRGKAGVDSSARDHVGDG